MCSGCGVVDGGEQTVKDLRVKLQAIADEIVNTIVEKDVSYGSSWKSHGGFSAFFNLDRKYSRLQNMAQNEKYDLFSAVLANDDGPDTLQDLIAYALLTLTETYNPPGYVDPEEEGIRDEDDKRDVDDGAGPDYVNQNGAEEGINVVPPYPKKKVRKKKKKRKTRDKPDPRKDTPSW